jgi:hypothetical protein
MLRGHNYAVHGVTEYVMNVAAVPNTIMNPTPPLRVCRAANALVIQVESTAKILVLG